MQKPSLASSRQTAGFIESMLSDLRTMSRSIDARFLVYLIELAMIEASDIRAQEPKGQRMSDRDVATKLSPEKISQLYYSGALD